MIEIVIIGSATAALVLGFTIGWFLNTKTGKKGLNSAEQQAQQLLATAQSQANQTIQSAEQKAAFIIESAEEKSKQILNEASKEANNIKREKLLEVKDEWYKKKIEFDTEVNTKRQEIQNTKHQLTQREESIDKRFNQALQKEKENKNFEQELTEKKSLLERKLADFDKQEQLQNQRLEKISGLTSEEAKRLLISNMENQAQNDAAKIIREIIEKAKMDAKKDAQKIVVQAIQRSAGETAVESTVSVLHIQSDEIKGRIIGKEGRNIKAFEAATGVDVIVDDTPEAVILSSFDMFRREVARVSLERLIADGRIQPARIEEIVEKVRGELEEEMFKIGENTIMKLGIHGMHNELIKLVGKMKYRGSYGQNILEHSIETAYLCGNMAAELGLDPVMAKRSGLLHDIGKVMDREYEGPHALIGYELTKKYREHPTVCNAVGAHHDDIEMEHPIAALVQSADAISGARPGARREPIEGYIKRLETLESLAKSFEGVVKTYAIQAGREVRVVVEHERIDDISADKLARDIAVKIEDEMEYPGQIKVTVIREVRKIAFAK